MNTTSHWIVYSSRSLASVECLLSWQKLGYRFAWEMCRLAAGNEEDSNTMARNSALFVTLLGAAVGACTVTVNKGPTEPAPAPTETAAPAPAATPAPTAEPASAPKPKPAKNYKLDKNGQVHIPGNIVFEYDSAVIKESDEGTAAVLSELKKFLDENPRVTMLRIEGHTDNQGDDAYNMKLSVARALAVKAWLMKQGIPEGRLIAVGFGETRPIADNSTEEGKAQNRRTEFHVAELDGNLYLGRPKEGPAGGQVAK